MQLNSAVRNNHGFVVQQLLSSACCFKCCFSASLAAGAGRAMAAAQFCSCVDSELLAWLSGAAAKWLDEALPAEVPGGLRGPKTDQASFCQHVASPLLPCSQWQLC